MLEELIGFQMSELETPLSLGYLNELKAFNKAEQIQEISGQASSESSLEMLLKKVSKYMSLLIIEMIINIKNDFDTSSIISEIDR
ncbi:unnamed protein product [Schistosoma mattheei]|uniref:Uncharacterized protein n=1 Tax=Schistosoma mattheei TaxID=31246 RepID=A0A183PWZ9_9TREM|nr:unnamed protein product [Schistosoma mattheei]